MGRFFFCPDRGDTQRVRHMQRRADTGIGIEGIQKADTAGQKIVIGKHFGAQILPCGVKDIAKHCQNLSNHDIGLQPLEAIHMVKQKISKGKNDQHIPKGIRNEEPFAKWDPIIQPNMDRMTVFRRDQILRKKV